MGGEVGERMVGAGRMGGTKGTPMSSSPPIPSLAAPSLLTSMTSKTSISSITEALVSLHLVCKINNCTVYTRFYRVKSTTVQCTLVAIEYNEQLYFLQCSLDNDLGTFAGCKNVVSQFCSQCTVLHKVQAIVHSVQYCTKYKQSTREYLKYLKIG